MGSPRPLHNPVIPSIAQFDPPLIFLWGYIKDIMYWTKCNDLPDLCHRILDFKHLERETERYNIAWCLPHCKGGKSADTAKCLVSVYSFHLKHLTHIFIGSEVIQFPYWPCSFWIPFTISELDQGNEEGHRNYDQVPNSPVMFWSVITLWYKFDAQQLAQLTFS
jgi:hypothetical protein